MNQPDAQFLIVNVIASICWLYLAALPFKPLTQKVVMSIGIALLCVLYAVVWVNSQVQIEFKTLTMLSGWEKVLQVPGMPLLLWMHVIIFNLAIGTYIAANAGRYGISQLLVLPCLIFTCLLGPIGLLLYLVIRWNHTRNYFADNF